ncbi:MAG: acyl-CoA carboxylase subunit beta [Sphingobacteriales bacterium]|nr:acyl-CoA carboxylase subunit beta [Sphingobacteriales bacterium]MBP9141836.1 acyl-CoA carboxylase subunit beta [Chitinophagales bacterium]MDA0199525.1 acyl-CoA carboxylase subunit beta [Bacteroidota bacterium]MBK7527685.1 acyl-CoA carboxylase subunit beta [Sphingobacteriales bacterium]MBK8678676.1 acyl-CoA carboxylase subunit beta [Sphingobacteriales bacterium]
MDLEFNRNEDALKLATSEVKQRLSKIALGGGTKQIEKLHKQGKLTARERIALLIDKDRPFTEIGAFAGYEMYAEQGGCPAGGVVVGLGYVSKRLCVIVANDATVKSGAWFPITAKKNLRAQEIAMENHLPIIYLVDSAGVFLPMQDEVFPDKEHFGRIFRNNSIMSAMGILQIAAIMGSCVAGGAYLPILSDEALIVDKTGSVFLAGPYLVKAAIGENVDSETLGGAEMHSEISGVTDYRMPDDQTCLKTIRNLISQQGHPEKAGFDRFEAQPPALPATDLYGIYPEKGAKPYKTIELIKRLVDKSEYIEYKAGYGRTITCAYARIDGWAVGIVANNREIIRTKKGETQIGGVIYSDSADKAARFIMICNQKRIPLVFLQDVTGFMVGSRSEQGGIIKDGAKMVNVMSNSIVPKFTVIVGNSYGAGNYAMCGKAYDPRLIVAWPTAKIAVMGGEQAAKTLLQIQVSSRKGKGEEITEAEQAQLLQQITERYQRQTTPYYAAARLWVDAIIDPLETRQIISMGIEAANHAPITQPFKVGVLQT